MPLQRFLLLTAFLIGVANTGMGQDKRAEAKFVSWQMLFLGPREVVPVEVRVSADEGPSARRRKLAEMLMARFDSDKDGSLSPAEAALVPLGVKVSGPGMGDGWKALDQRPSDQQLNLEELLTFVDRELGPAFQISTRPPRLAQSVQLVQRIDQDGNAAISASEVEQSLQVLRGSDLDDDEAVSVGELQPFPRRGVVRQPEQQPRESPLISIEQATEIQAAAERAIRVYGLGATSVPVEVSGELGRAFDADADGRLNLQELSQWFAARHPAWIISANLGQRRASTVEVRPADAAAGSPTKPGPKVSATLGGAAVEITAQNNQREQSDVKSMYGIRFLQSDRDKNGYVDEMEFPGLQLAAAFRDADANADGMLMREELSSFVAFDAIAVQARMELMVADEGKTLFELLDANTDRRLTPRELQSGFARLENVDRNQDQMIAQTELESRYHLTFSYGRNQIFAPNTPGMNSPVTARLRNQNQGPVWYRRMDRNQDGDITWREFLGTRSQLQSLDTNSDGLIDRSEADAFPSTSGSTEAQPDVR